VFRWLHLLAVRAQQDKTQPQPASAGRRHLLLGSAAAVAGAAVAGGAGQWLVSRVDVQGSRSKVTAFLARYARPSIPSGVDFAAQGTPTFLTPNASFYRVDTALSVPRLRAEDWSLRVHGMVDRELRLTFDDIRARKLVTRTITVTCVSNEVGGPYVSTADFTGVLLRDLLAEAGVHGSVDQVLSSSVDGYSAGTPLETVMDPHRDAMLAIGMNGEALPPEHGFPARLVVPGVYGYASATKWLTDIELTTFAAKKQYWVPGTHQVLCRATDTSGRTQTRDRVSPVPNGATGWHTIVFTTT